MTKLMMAILVVVMMTGLVSAQETAPNCTPVQKVKTVPGPRGPVGPAGPQGTPGAPGQVPEWYLGLGLTGLLFGLLGTGFGIAALMRPYPPAAQAVNVINVPVPTNPAPAQRV